MDLELEKKLIIRTQAGDHQAFAQLVEHYKSPVFNLIYRMTNGSTEESDDLAQETFLRIYDGIGSFDPLKRFFPWLYTICLNVIRDYLKKKKAAYASAQKLFEEQGEKNNNPEELYSQRQKNEIVQECLHFLPEDQRAAIILRYFQELAFDDIAEILGVSASGAKMRVYRGLATMQTDLKQDK
jgi:RNA polymerase sigma-70 factor (ECF subfamily)